MLVVLSLALSEPFWRRPLTGSKSKVSAQGDRITLDGITPEQFDRLVSLLAHWISSGEVVARFTMPSVVKLDFDEASISRQLKDKQLPSGCISQLRYDISLMLQGILGGHRKSAASFIADNSSVGEIKGAAKPSKEQIREEVETRIRCVEEKVVTADLRRQFAIKSSAKTNTYVGVSWDIVEKRSDSTGSTPPDIVHATVRINAGKPRAVGIEREIFIPYLYAIPGYTAELESYVLTMTLEDLRDLVEKLGNAVKALRQAMEVE